MNADLLFIRLRKLSVSIIYPTCWRALSVGVAPSVEHLTVLKALKIDGLIDVGANRGQFTLACRLAQPDLPVVAFEPIAAEAATFRRVHGDRSNVQLIESALGETKGQATLHLSNSADSSSLLPIGKNRRSCSRTPRRLARLPCRCIASMTSPSAGLDDPINCSSWMCRALNSRSCAERRRASSPALMSTPSVPKSPFTKGRRYGWRWKPF